MKKILLMVTLTLGTGAAALSQVTPVRIPAILSGQSNARDLSPHLPGGSHVLVARGATPIRFWAWDQDLGQQLLATLTAYDPSVFIWWQGESDGLDGTSAAEYRERLLTILWRVQERRPTPIMIVEMADHPTRMHLKAVQAELAQHALVALIPTAGLPMDGPHDFAPEAHQEVARRLMVCYFMECWRIQ